MRMRGRWLVAVLAVAGAAACVGGSMTIAQRFAAVHNVLGPAGFSQVGPISEGELGQGETTEVALPLVGGQCYSISAIGGAGVWDLGAELLDPSGSSAGGDVARGPQASLHYCAATSGPHKLVVRMIDGAGDFVVAVWAGGAGAFGGGGGGGGGTCDAPATLTPGATVRGSTANGMDGLSPPCLGPGDSMAPDAVYQFTLDSRGSFSALLSSQYDAVLYLLSDCSGDPMAVIDCNDDAEQGDTAHSRVSGVLEAGTYYLVVDGYGSDAGNYALDTDFEALRPVEEVCGDLPVLTPGVETAGDTSGQGDDFRTSPDCAGGSRAPDVAYQLVIDAPSRVRVHLDSDYDGALAVRSNCAQQSSVVACNDDFGEGDEGLRASEVVAALQPGTYTVIVDGYEGEQGTFRLTATVVPEGQATAPNDTCATAQALGPDQDGTADTFAAADDLRGSCVGQPGGADVVYRVAIEERSLLQADASGAGFPDPVLYLQRTCGEDETEVACATRSLSAVVDPGTYFLVADAPRRDAFGEVTVRYELSDVGPLEAVCSDAPVLAPGEEVEGRTTGEDRFQATCGDGARNPEAIYSLRIRERSQVELSVEARYDSVLYVRRDCVDPGSEVDCNDDAGDAEHSRLDLTLDPGTYYVFVDGYGAGGESGSFTLRAEVSSP
jgi:hypothetical protein